jgi:hypothetical protein
VHPHALQSLDHLPLGDRRNARRILDHDRRSAPGTPGSRSGGAENRDHRESEGRGHVGGSGVVAQEKRSAADQGFDLAQRRAHHRAVFAKGRQILARPRDEYGIQIQRCADEPRRAQKAGRMPSLIRLRRHSMDHRVLVGRDSSPARVLQNPLPSNPVDICGAGDSFSAGASLALRVTGSPAEAARFGNLVASITIMKKGTGTASPEEVLAAHARQTNPGD